MTRRCHVFRMFLALLASLAVCDFVVAEPVPRGRLHLDYAAHDADARPLGDGFHLRRARIGLGGSVGEDWGYRIEYDFAENDVGAREVWLRYRGLPAGNATLGQFKVPFGLEELTSSNAITFIERSLPTTTFAQNFRVGLGYEVTRPAWHTSLMVFGQPSGAQTRGTEGDEGLGLGARVVLRPVRTATSLVHLGLAATIESPADDDLREVRLRTRPESRPSNLRLVDTGLVGGVRNIGQLGVEAAWRSGPLSLQGEWMHSTVARREGEADLNFTGWYVAGSWVLTGEARDHDGSVFGGPSPRGGGGAWELVARFSAVDLNDGRVRGGRQRNVTVGVNWYATSAVRFMLNLIRVDSARAGIQDEPIILLGRAQVAF